jgi:hypothetical protein
MFASWTTSVVPDKECGGSLPWGFGKSTIPGKCWPFTGEGIKDLSFH